MQQQILVTLNGSHLSEAILPHALALADATHSGITLLRTVTLPRNFSTGLAEIVPPENWYDEEQAWTRTYLNNIAGSIRKHGVEAQVVMLDGDPATNIVSYASHQPNVRLIAMASHGRERVGRWLLGSVATQVIHEMPKPVVLMHPSSNEHAPSGVLPAYHNIIVPFDGSTRSESVLEFAQPLIRAFGATITLVQVEPASSERSHLEEGQTSIEHEAQQLREAGLTVQMQAPTDDPSELIRQLSRQQRDVLLMVAQREKLEELVMKFIHQIGVPVVVVPVKK
jgi:nucleotide-binding universal stress UspA family protein